MDVLLETSPHPPLETSRTLFDTVEAPEALFIVQALRLSAVYKSTLRARPDSKHTNILKYQYTYENAGFCILYLDRYLKPPHV